MIFSTIFFLALKLTSKLNPTGSDWIVFTFKIILFQAIILFVGAGLGFLNLACWISPFILALYLAGTIRNRPAIQLSWTPTDYYWLAFFTLGALCTFQMRVHFSDEFQYWGALQKYLHTYNELPIDNKIIRFMSFIPGQPIFLHYLTHLETFSESNWYFAQFLLVFYILSLGLDLISQQYFTKHSHRILFLLSFCWLLLGLFILKKNSFTLFNLSPDLPLSIFFFGTLLSSLLSNRQEAKWLLLMNLTLLTAFKGQGVVLALIGLCAWTFLSENRLPLRNTILTWAGAIFIFAGIKFGWELFLKAHAIPKTYNEQLIGLIDFAKQIITNSWLDDQKVLLQLLMNRLWMTKWELLIPFAGLALLAPSKTKIRWLFFYTISALTYIGLIVYFYLFVIMKVFPNEALSGNSFERILYIHHLSWTLLISCLALKKISTLKISPRFTTIATFLLTVALGNAFYQHKVHANKWEGIRDNFLPDAKKILDRTPNEASIFMICQTKKPCTLEYWTLMYEGMPRQIDGDVAIVKTWPDPRYGSYNQINWESFLERVSDRNLVLVRNIDPDFWNNFGTAFNNTELGLYENLKRTDNQTREPFIFKFLPDGESSEKK